MQGVQEQLRGGEGGTIRMFAPGVRIGLAGAAIAMIVAMTILAQVPESNIDEPRVAATSKADTGNTDSATPPVRENESYQRIYNELRREILDDRADTIDWWLTGITVFLGLVTIVVVVASYMTVSRAREFNTEAEKHAEAAKRHLEDIASNLHRSDEIVRKMTAVATADSPEEMKQASEKILENPNASPIDKAIARAVSLQRLGQKASSAEMWRAIAHIAEESDKHLAARAWYSVGYLIVDNTPKDAISANDQAIRLDPTFAAAYVNRGCAKGRLRQNKEAISDFDQAVRLEPNFAEAYSNRGIAKGWLGSHQEAISDLDQAIRLKPDFADAYSNRGTAKHRLQQYQEAISDFDQAIRLKPSFAEAYLKRGDTKEQLGGYEDAIADYDQAILLESALAEAYLARGTAKGQLGMHEDAITDFDQTVRLRPDCAEAYGNRGNAKGQLGRYRDAIADYDKAVQLKPGYHKAYFKRGLAKCLLGDKAGARKDYETSLHLAKKSGNPEAIVETEKAFRDLDNDES